MSNNKDKFILLDKSIDMNGPSIGLGAFFMILGVICTLIGLGHLGAKAILCGLVFLALAAFLILSIKCIAINRAEEVIWIYKDYFLTKVGEKFPLNGFTSVCIYYKVGYSSSRLTNRGARSNSYSVALISKEGEIQVIKDSGNLNLAKNLQHLIAKETGLHLNKELIRERD